MYTSKIIYYSDNCFDNNTTPRYIPYSYFNKDSFAYDRLFGRHAYTNFYIIIILR